MPDCSGLDSLRAVRTHRPDVPLLVLSGLEGPTVVRECVDLGAFGFVPKSAPGDPLEVSNRTEAVYALARPGVGINDLQVQDRP